MLKSTVHVCVWTCILRTCACGIQFQWCASIGGGWSMQCEDSRCSLFGDWLHVSSVNLRCVFECLSLLSEVN